LRLGKPKRVSAAFLTAENENISSFKNVMCFLEYQTMDKVQKLNNPDCNTPKAKPFIINNKVPYNKK
jgi:hypothetical protein